MIVDLLIPGDIVTDPLGNEHIFIGSIRPHPLWVTLDMVIWKLADGTWSFDALHPLQDVGEPKQVKSSERVQQVRYALLGDSDDGI